MKKVFSLVLAVLVLVGIGFSFGGSISSAYTTNSYTWNNVKIGGGGFVTGLVYSPVENGLLFARTDVGGAYRFDSPTKTWIPLTDFIGRTDRDDMGVLSIAVDPTNANKVYMMTGLYTSQWAGNGNFYASTDKGATWTKTALPFKVGGNDIGRNTGERLQVDRNLTNVLYMGSTTDGLYKSTNSGANWSKVTSFPATNINFVILDPSSTSPGTATSRIIVGANGTSNTMYISNNGGSTWSTISGQPSGYCPIRADIASGTLYVTFSAFSSKPGDMPGPSSADSGVIYKYNISTGAWTNVTPSGEGTYFGFGGISVDKQNANHIVATSLDNYWPVGGKVYQTFNGGSTWTEIFRSGTRTVDKAPYASESNINWLADIKIDPFNSNKAIFTHGGGVYMTDALSSSSVTWSFEVNGMEETALFEVKSPPSGTNLFSAMGDVGAFKHDNLVVSPPEGEFTPGDASNNYGIDFAESVPTKVVRSYDKKSSTSYGAYSTNGGNTWTEFASAPSNAGAGGYIAISADGSKIVWTPRDSSYNYMAPYVSTNNGSSWTASSGGVIGKKPVADRVNSNKFYQFDYENGIVYVSTNGGASFTAGATGLPTVPNYSANDADMEAVFGKEGHLWAATGAGGLYYSTNSGTSFTKLSNVTEAYKVGFGKAAATGGYPAIFLNGIVEGTYGFFRSDDQGASWVRINDAAHQFGNIVDITGDPKVYGRIYIGVGGRGVIYGDLSGIQSGHVYELVNRNSGKALDVNGGSTADGGDVIQWTWSNGNNQKWRIDNLGNGYYTLTNVNSGKLLDVIGGSTADGGNVIQWSSTGGTNQQWQIIDNGGGYYRLINRNSGKALDVNGGSTADGGDVIQWTWSSGNNQQWTLVPLN